MKRPEEMTQQAFCKLVVSECEARGWTKASAAAHCGVSTQAMVDIGQNKFPGECVGNKALERGRKTTIMSICEALGLDMEACLRACGLDPNQLPARKLLKHAHVTIAQYLTLDLEDVAVLKKSIELLGPLPLTTALELLSLARAKREKLEAT
jgi:hypothetical protein